MPEKSLDGSSERNLRRWQSEYRKKPSFSPKYYKLDNRMYPFRYAVNSKQYRRSEDNGGRVRKWNTDHKVERSIRLYNVHEFLDQLDLDQLEMPVDNNEYSRLESWKRPMYMFSFDGNLTKETRYMDGKELGERSKTTKKLVGRPGKKRKDKKQEIPEKEGMYNSYDGRTDISGLTFNDIEGLNTEDIKRMVRERGNAARQKEYACA